MKRVLLLICALLLLIDLADDGYLGKVNYVFPHGQGAGSFDSPSQKNNKIDFQFGLPPPKSSGSPHCWQYLTKSVEVTQSAIINDDYLLSSAGGIPL
jgi:hypothetical protein